MNACGCARAGKAKYDSKKHALVWKIKKFTGATEHSLVSAVELIATTREKRSWSRPPISMTFQVGFSHANDSWGWPSKPPPSSHTTEESDGSLGLGKPVPPASSLHAGRIVANLCQLPMHPAVQCHFCVPFTPSMSWQACSCWCLGSDVIAV